MVKTKKTNSLSFWAFVFISVWLICFRTTHVVDNEISWDVFGYYLPLQATFIEGDMWLDDAKWVDELNKEHNVTGSLYQISSTPDNQPMYFFLMGMSIMYSVFFFIGHFFAGILDYPQNGLSDPYTYALVLGCILYTIIGLYYLRKILLHFFSDKLTLILLIICVFGTNYVNHMTLKNLETVNVLFMFYAIVLWNTIRWYETYKFKNMLAIGVSIVLMALIKPSEVLVILLPFIWGLTSWRNIKNRVLLLWSFRNQIILTALICLIIASPQMIYWYVKTGAIFYDSYKNPGVGLDFLSPHIFESLFGYRKGWLLYTPIMVFALLGFITIYKRRKDLFLGLFIPFVLAFYIIASWTEYWYGAGFSNRPVITVYPILLISMGFLFQWVWNQRLFFRVLLSITVLFFIFLNQFQWLQYRNYIIDGSRMTKAYYWKVFLKMKIDDGDRDLLLINRSSIPGEVHQFRDRDRYKSKQLLFSPTIETQTLDGKNLEFMNTVRIPYYELTRKDHCYVRFQMDYKVKGDKETFLAIMMNRKDGDYNHHYVQINQNTNDWQRLDTCYLTPEIRSVKDYFSFFIWNPNFQQIEAKNLRVEVYERKE